MVGHLVVHNGMPLPITTVRVTSCVEALQFLCFLPCRDRREFIESRFSSYFSFPVPYDTYVPEAVIGSDSRLSRIIINGFIGSYFRGDDAQQ